MKDVVEVIFKEIPEEKEYVELSRRVIETCFKNENIPESEMYISITLCGEGYIKEINKTYRNIDKATDVLSFPMFEKWELENRWKNTQSIDKMENTMSKTSTEDLKQNGEIQDVLGDIIVSIPKVKEQAVEYGHSFEREFAYMLVHGFYHLMGYDHMKEEDKKMMRKKEEKVLKELNINRNESLSNKNFFDAWRNAINGIIYATTTQGNIKKQLIIAVAVVIISLFFNLSRAEFLCFMFTIVLIIFAEMVNTAIETVVDLYVDVYHPKAKIAKDVAAGGVVITTINALIVAYFLFFDKISEMGLSFITNVAKSPSHLAFSVIVITVISALALIAYSRTNKHKILNSKFIPSGYAILAFAANTIIWISTDNIVILILSLTMSILVAGSRVEAKAHKISEIIFSGGLGTLIVLVLYGLATVITNVL